MKFIHSGDIHLGAAPDSGKSWASGRAKEIWETLKNIIEETNKRDADMLIISGDLFHRQPLKSELKEVNSLFARLTRAKVVIVAGNHDCIRKGSYYRDFEWNENVTFIMSEEMSVVGFDDINTEVYGLSYYKNEITQPKYDEISIKNSQAINILLAHGGDEKHIPINKRKLALAGFDYVALGHIHKYAVYEDLKMAYCGSPEPIDVNETGEHGFIYGEVTKEDLKLEFVPFSKRIYKHVVIEVTPDVTNADLIYKIQSVINEFGTDNMYKFIIHGYKDADVEFDISDIEKLGNVVLAVDATDPDYDFDKLRENNKDNIIGMYIEQFIEDDANKKALYYGTKALLDAMEER